MNLSFRFDLAAPPWVFDLVTHLWQSTVVALVVLSLMALGGRLAARTRRALGWIAVAKFALPAAWLAHWVEQTSGAPKSWLTSAVLTLPLNLIPDAPVVVTTGAGIPVTSLLAAIWLAGSAGLLACWWGRARQARRRMLAGSMPVPDGLKQRVAAAAAVAGLRQVPRCALVAPEHGPAVVGVLAPVLVLPRGLAEVLAPRELDSILIHECVHLQRRDNLWNAALAVFAAALWFHPIAWLLSRAIGCETEKSCDERVLAITGDAETYACGIVASVRHSLGVMRPGFSGATTPPVLGRIKAILAHPVRRERPAARWAFLLVGAVLVALSGRAGSFAAQTTATPPPTAAAVAPTPEPSDAGKPPRYKIGTITITFAGDANVSEQVVRDAMQIRAGGEFDEAALDRDMRSIYRTGWFKFVEVKHEPAGSATFNLVVVLTPKPAEGNAGPTTPVTIEPAPTVDQTPGKGRMSEVEVKEAKRKRDLASERLKKLREERAAMLAAAGKKPEEVSVRTGTSDVAAPIVPASPPSAAPATHNAKPVYDISALDRPPVARFQSRPRYPFAMRQSGITGEVVVDFIVDDQGDVVKAYALRSSRTEFEAAAVRAVSQWKFRSGQKGGQDVSTHMQVPIVFTLDER